MSQKVRWFKAEAEMHSPAPETALLRVPPVGPVDQHPVVPDLVQQISAQLATMSAAQYQR